MSVKILRDIEGASVEVLTLDATISEQIDYASEPTEHAIEDGSVITDHAIEKPRSVSVTGFVSNYPIKYLTGGIIPQKNVQRRKDAYDALVALLKDKERVSVSDELDVHRSMMLVALSIPRDKTSFHGLRFTANFREVKVVTVIDVEISEDDKSAVPPKDIGVVTPVDSTPEETERGSLLWELIKGE
jgi:hypothetical protein